MTNTEPRPVRQTRQRATIRAYLMAFDDFRTAQQVHEGLSSDGERVGLATVYRALQSMTTAGELDWLRTPEGEVAYRACSSGHHHHMVCRRCGFTVEIGAEQVERWAASVAASNGFTNIEHEVELFGLCPDCSAPTAG